MSPSLLIERPSDGVVLLTLNEPGRRNAMTEAMTAAWTEALADLRSDPDLRCCVVTGTGAAFCAGGDLSWMTERPDLGVDAIRSRMLPFYQSWLAVQDLPVPVVAAVNGPAIGAGLCLALACDIRYCGTGAVFSAPFVALGMHPGMGATALLPAVVGPAVAADLLYTARRVDATEALRIGLVSRVLPPDELLPVALEAASAIAGHAPVAVQLTKATLAAGPLTVPDAVRVEALAQPVTMATAEFRGRMSAAAGRPTSPPS